MKQGAACEDCMFQSVIEAPASTALWSFVDAAMVLKQRYLVLRVVHSRSVETGRSTRYQHHCYSLRVVATTLCPALLFPSSLHLVSQQLVTVQVCRINVTVSGSNRMDGLFLAFEGRRNARASGPLMSCFRSQPTPRPHC